MSEEEYVLGCDQEELERLGQQHDAWSEKMDQVLKRAGIQAGQKVLDLGSGPGFTTFQIAEFVGPEGSVVGVDESRVFIEALERMAKLRGLKSVSGEVSGVESLGLAPESFDAAYGRWILSWLEDASVVTDQIYEALVPGGTYVLQEYLDWGRMRLLPRVPEFDLGIKACFESWAVSGGFINISEKVPEFAKRVGFEVESFKVVARQGRPGSKVWGWLNEFYRIYFPKLVERGLMDAGVLDHFLDAWTTATKDPTSIVLAPVMADIVLRKPLN